MSEQMGKSEFVRTAKIFNEIGFTPSNTIFAIAMRDYKVSHRQFGGIDHWNLKESIKALYKYYLKLSYEYGLIHKNNPNDNKYGVWSEKYILCANYSKEAYNRLTVMDNG